MARYRQGELKDAHWLESYETEHGLTVIHGKQYKNERDGESLAAGWIGRHIPLLPGFKTWVIGLTLFGIAAAFVLVVAICAPTALEALPS